VVPSSGCSSGYTLHWCPAVRQFGCQRLCTCLVRRSSVRW
jgi:hypothetical protein